MCIPCGFGSISGGGCACGCSGNSCGCAGKGTCGGDGGSGGGGGGGNVGKGCGRQVVMIVVFVSVGEEGKSTIVWPIVPLFSFLC